MEGKTAVEEAGKAVIKYLNNYKQTLKELQQKPLNTPIPKLTFNISAIDDIESFIQGIIELQKDIFYYVGKKDIEYTDFIKADNLKKVREAIKKGEEKQTEILKKQPFAVKVDNLINLRKKIQKYQSNKGEQTDLTDFVKSAVELIDKNSNLNAQGTEIKDVLKQLRDRLGSIKTSYQECQKLKVESDKERRVVESFVNAATNLANNTTLHRNTQNVEDVADMLSVSTKVDYKAKNAVYHPSGYISNELLEAVNKDYKAKLEPNNEKKQNGSEKNQNGSEKNPSISLIALSALAKIAYEKDNKQYDQDKNRHTIRTWLLQQEENQETMLQQLKKEDITQEEVSKLFLQNLRATDPFFLFIKNNLQDITKACSEAGSSQGGGGNTSANYPFSQATQKMTNGLRARPATSAKNKRNPQQQEKKKKDNGGQQNNGGQPQVKNPPEEKKKGKNGKKEERREEEQKRLEEKKKEAEEQKRREEELLEEKKEEEKEKEKKRLEKKKKEEEEKKRLEEEQKRLEEKKKEAEEQKRREEELLEEKKEEEKEKEKKRLEKKKKEEEEKKRLEEEQKRLEEKKKEAEEQKRREEELLEEKKEEEKEKEKKRLEKKKEEEEKKKKKKEEEKEEEKKKKEEEKEESQLHEDNDSNSDGRNTIAAKNVSNINHESDTKSDISSIYYTNQSTMESEYNEDIPLTINREGPIINDKRVNRPQIMQYSDKLEGLDYKSNNIDTEILRKYLQDIYGKGFAMLPPFATYLFKPYIEQGLDTDGHKALYNNSIPITVKDGQTGPEEWEEYDDKIKKWFENNDNWKDGKYTPFDLQVVDKEELLDTATKFLNERNLLKAAEVFFKPTKTQKEIKDAIDTLNKLLPIAYNADQWYDIGADRRTNRGNEIIALMHGLQLQQEHLFAGDVIGKENGKDFGGVDNRGVFEQMEDLLTNYIKNPEATGYILKQQTEQLTKIAGTLGRDLGDVNKRDLIQFVTFADFVEASLRKNASKNDSEYKDLLKHLDPVFASGDIFKEKDRTRALAERIALGDLDIVQDDLKKTLAEKCKYFKNEIEEPLSTLITNHGTIAARAAVVHNQICDLKSNTIPKDLLDLYGKYKNSEWLMDSATHFYDSRYNNPNLLNIKKQILDAKPHDFAGNDSLVAKTASLLGLKVNTPLKPEELKEKLTNLKTELAEFAALGEPKFNQGQSTIEGTKTSSENQKKAIALLQKLKDLGLEKDTELKQIAEYLQAIQQSKQNDLAIEELKKCYRHTNNFLQVTNHDAFAAQVQQYADIARVAVDAANAAANAAAQAAAANAANANAIAIAANAAANTAANAATQALAAANAANAAANAANAATQALAAANAATANANANAARAKEVASLVTPIDTEALLQKANKLCSVASYAAANANAAAAAANQAVQVAAAAAAKKAAAKKAATVIANVYGEGGVYTHCINAVERYILDFATRVNVNIANCRNTQLPIQEYLETYKKLEIELQQFKEHLKANEMGCFDDVLKQQEAFLTAAKTEYEAALNHYKNATNLQGGNLQPALQDRLKVVFGNAGEKIDEIIAAIDIEERKKAEYEHALAIEQDEINKKDSLDLAFKANSLSTDVEESMLRLDNLNKNYKIAIANIVNNLPIAELQKLISDKLKDKKIDELPKLKLRRIKSATNLTKEGQFDFNAEGSKTKDDEDIMNKKIEILFTECKKEVSQILESYFEGLPVPCQNDPYLKILKGELLGNIKGFSALIDKKYGILHFLYDRKAKNPALQTIAAFYQNSFPNKTQQQQNPLTTAQSSDIIKQYAEEAKNIAYYKDELKYPKGTDEQNEEVEKANNYREFLVGNLELYKAAEDYGKDKDKAKYKAALINTDTAFTKITSTNLSEILKSDEEDNPGLIDLKKKHQNDLLKNAVIKEIPDGNNLPKDGLKLQDCVVYKKSKDGFVKDDKHTGIKAPKAGEVFSIKLPDVKPDDGKMLVLTAQKLNDGKVVLTDKYNRVYTVLDGKLYLGGAKDEEKTIVTATTEGQTTDPGGKIISNTTSTTSSKTTEVKTTQKFLSNGTLFEGTPLVLMDKKDNILLYQFCGCTLYKNQSEFIALTPDEYGNTFVIQNTTLKVSNGLKLDSLINKGIINTAVDNGDAARKRISQKTIEDAKFIKAVGLNNWQFAAASGLFIASLTLGVYVAEAKPTWIDTEVVNNNIMEYLKSTGVKITPEVQKVADDLNADLKQFQQQFDSLSAGIKPQHNTLAEWQKALKDMNAKESFFTKDNITNYVECKDGKLYFRLSNIFHQKFSNRDGLSMLDDKGTALANATGSSGPFDIMDGKTVAIVILAALFLIFAVGIIALANSDVFKHKEYSVITKDKDKNPKAEALITVQIQDDMEKLLKEPKIVNKQIAKQIKEFIKIKAQELALRIETNDKNEYIFSGIDKLSPFEVLILNKIVLPDLKYRNLCVRNSSLSTGDSFKYNLIYGGIELDYNTIDKLTRDVNYNPDKTNNILNDKTDIPLFTESSAALSTAQKSFVADSFQYKLLNGILTKITTEPEAILDDIDTQGTALTQEQKLNALFKMGFAPVEKKLVFDVKIISKKISSGQGVELIDLLLQDNIDGFVDKLSIADDIVKERFKQYLKDNEDKKKKLIAWIYTQLSADKQLKSDTRWNLVGTTLRYALLASSFASLAVFVFSPQLVIVPNLLPAVLVILATFWALGRLFNYYKKNLEKEGNAAKTAIQILIGLGGVAAIGAIAFGIGSSVLSAGLSPILAMVACLIIMAALKSAAQRITDTWNRNTGLNLFWLFVTPLGFDPGAFTLSDQNDKNIFRKFLLPLLGASRLDVLKARTSGTSYAQVLIKRFAVILAIAGAICFAAGHANAGIGLIAAALSLSVLFELCALLKAWLAWLKKDTIKEAPTKDWKSAIVPLATLASCAALVGVGIGLATNPQLLNNQWMLLLLVVLCVLTVVLYSHFSNQNKTLEEKRHDAMEDFVKNKEPVLLRTTYDNEVVKAAEQNFYKGMEGLDENNVNDLGEYKSASTSTSTSTSTPTSTSISKIYHDQLAEEAKDKGVDKENGFVLFWDGFFGTENSKIKFLPGKDEAGNDNSKVVKSDGLLDRVKKIFTGRNT